MNKQPNNRKRRSRSFLLNSYKSAALLFLLASTQAPAAAQTGLQSNEKTGLQASENSAADSDEKSSESTTSKTASKSNANTNWRVRRATLDREFADRLEEIAGWCRENKIPQQIAETFKLYRPRDLQRQYIFLPSEKSMPQPINDGALGQWIGKINEVKSWQAERIFELAKEAAAAGAGNSAFQLLNEVLYFNKDHEQVREILGHRKTDDGWRVAPEKVSVRQGTRDHTVIQWPANSYIRVVTPHFEIDSNASEERTRYLAEKLERWQSVWRQVFFEYWSSSSVLQRWIDGKSSYRHSKKRFHVVFFRDRNEYLAALSKSVRGIENSTGYYSSDQSVSFFYDSPAAVDEAIDPTVEDTWRHELTHQLFREAIKTDKNLFDENYIWLDEGIATYFESLADFGGYVTLGGFESRRLQYARIRLLLENFYVPLAELSAIGRTELQSRPDMVRIYSQSAGVADMLMNDGRGEMEPKLTDFFKLLYRGRKIKDNTFESMIGQSFEELDQRYREYLSVSSQTVEQHLSLPNSRTELSVAGSNLEDEAFTAIGKCHNLGWLDLTSNTITAERIGLLRGCSKITQVFMTECRIYPGALATLTQFEQLDELDLSGSSVANQQLGELAGLKNLTALRLIKTNISDAGIPALLQLPNLQTIYIARTGITNAGVMQLKQRFPNLEVVK